MLTQEIIRRKRDGKALDVDLIDEFVAGITSGDVADAQVGAFAMAVFLMGMDTEECVALTRAMTRSGTQLKWNLDRPVLDKHSTGGVGDTVSLMLAPMVAACGGYVPMISGRGLGHTGGTFDKFESIPGYRAAPTMAEFRRVVKRVGCAVIGQTADLAPADKRLYGVRDVTATVESIPLITASILSKKLAAGLDALVMDVKVGRGAFMETDRSAVQLARSITSVATSAGVPTVALLTDMDQPLGSAAGNALEMAYAIDYLTGAVRESRMHAVVLALAAEMLVVGRLAESDDEARARLQRCLDDGSAAERFSKMVAALGGPGDLLSDPWKHLPRAPVVIDVPAPRTGFVRRIDTRAVGLAVVALGGGRTRPGDLIDHSVGITGLAAVGVHLTAGEPLAVVHARTESEAWRAVEEITATYTIGANAPIPIPVIKQRVTADA